MSDFILTSEENGVLTIQFNRAGKYNSFVREMALAFQDALDRAENEASIRCVVITGSGKAFCAGQDLAEAIDPEGPELSKIVSEHYNPIITRIRRLEKPVIAAVNGVAAGAGANIALACDVVYASASAKFIQAFSKIGLIPDSGGTFFLPRLIGMQRATALMMTGDPVSAEEAKAMGMIYDVFSDEEFAEKIQKSALKMAAMPTLGLGLTKRLLNQSYQNSLQEQLNQEDIVQTEAGQSYDYNEGVDAFLEKRKPNFKGQ